MLLNLALILLGRGSFLMGLIALSLVAYVAAPAAVIGALLYVSRKNYRLARVAFVIAAVGASAAVSLFVGGMVAERDVAAARRYCEDLVPRLETYRATHGRYPADIREVDPASAPPQLLRRAAYYHATNDEYAFDFMDPRGMMNGFVFTSTKRRWEEWD